MHPQQQKVTVPILQTAQMQAQKTVSFTNLSYKIMKCYLNNEMLSSQLTDNKLLRAATQRLDAAFASCETRTKLRKPCGKSARNSSCTETCIWRSRRANITESSSIGSSWHACNRTIVLIDNAIDTCSDVRFLSSCNK